jgi:hypothetical protein
MQSTYTRITVQGPCESSSDPSPETTFIVVVGAYREQQQGGISLSLSLSLTSFFSRRRKQKNVRIFQDEMEPTGRLLSPLDVHNYTWFGFVIDNTAMDGLFYYSIFEKKTFFFFQKPVQ